VFLDPARLEPYDDQSAFATASLIGVGFDWPPLDTLFLRRACVSLGFDVPKSRPVRRRPAGVELG
jgi:hypothetical protein